MGESVLVVGFLVVAYLVARFLAFLKKRVGEKGSPITPKEGNGRDVVAAVVAGIVVEEEDEKGERKRIGRDVRGRRREGVSWWRMSGRRG